MIGRLKDLSNHKQESRTTNTLRSLAIEVYRVLLMLKNQLFKMVLKATQIKMITQKSSNNRIQTTSLNYKTKFRKISRSKKSTMKIKMRKIKRIQTNNKQKRKC